MTTTVSVIDFTSRPIFERIVILAMIQEEDWHLFPDLALYTQHLFHVFSETFRAFAAIECLRLSQNGGAFMNRLAESQNFHDLLVVLMERYKSRDKRMDTIETNTIIAMIAEIMLLALKYHPWTTINQLEAIKSLKICHFYLNAPSQNLNKTYRDVVVANTK